MLIIFDLDDTLLATSKKLVPALYRAISNSFPCSEEVYKSLQETQARLSSSSQTLRQFGHPELVEDLFFSLCKEFPDCFLLEKEKALLQRLSVEHRLAVVTFGSKSWQQAKIDAMHLEERVDEVIICEEGSKGPFYEVLMEKFGFTPEQTLVCGDRLDRDLKPALELGCHCMLLGKEDEVLLSSGCIPISSLEQIEDYVRKWTGQAL